RDGDRGGRPPPHGDGLYGEAALQALGRACRPRGGRKRLESLLALEMVRVTEAAALASARFMGRGEKDNADRAAVEAMRPTMDEIEFAGTIVIGEGERDEAPMLFIGEEVGRHDEDDVPQIDIAVDPLEGTNLVAHGQANAITVLAASEKGGLTHAPDTYLEKLCVGPVVAGKVDIRESPTENIGRIAEALGRRINDITVVILDRPRHESLIAEVREAGARIKLITDGDLSAAISCAVSGTGVHAVMGIGGAPEGVLTAAALRCLGGEIQARFRYRSDEERARGAAMGHGDEERVYSTEDLASGESLVFAATGVTAGDLLQGVRFFGGGARTHSLVMAYQAKQVRFVDTVHMFDRDSPPRVRLHTVALTPGYKASAEQFPPRRLLDLAIAAERAGFDSVWTSDHFQPWRHTDGHAPNALVWLGAASQATQRVILGTSVLTPSFRYNPAMVAQAFATLGVLAPKRIILGVGTGESMNEVPVGVTWPEQSERFARLKEAVVLIKHLWEPDAEFVDYA